MIDNDFSKSICSILKRRASSLGITQEVLATRLNVSHPTVKRWLNGKSMTLENLNSLLDILQLSLSDISTEIEVNSQNNFTYNDLQESFFSKNPDYLAFFDNLLREKTPNQIRVKFNLSSKKMERYLARLDKLELIQWLPNNKVKLLVFGEPKWKKNGALSRTLKPQIFEDFISLNKSEDLYFSLQDYLPCDLLKIKQKINELIEMAQYANKRSSKAPNRSKPFGIFISLKPFRWSLDKFLSD